MSASIPSWARVGAKVVCIKQAANPITLRHQYPTKDAIYTIRKVVIDSDTGVPALLLEEVVNTSWEIPSKLEPGFNINGFRPLVEDSDELGIETQLYRAKGRKSKAPVRERERA